MAVKDTRKRLNFKRFFVFGKPQMSPLLIFQKYLIGFSYGVSFPLTLVLLDYWLKDCGITNTTISIFSITHLPFALKFFLAPVVDECKIPIASKILGQKRSWVIVSQLALIFSVLCMAQTNPKSNPLCTIFFSSFVAFADGIQNVALYPYQISGVKQEQFGYTASVVSFGHRIGSIATKCVTLYSAQLWGWKIAYECSSLLILGCMIAAVFIREPKLAISDGALENISKGIHHNVVLRPISSIFGDFWRETKGKLHTRDGIYTLLVVLLYKASDFTIQKMSRVFCLEIGFTKIDIANIVQFWGSIAVVFGGFLAGYLIKRKEILRTMIILSAIHMGVLFGYVVLNAIGNNTDMLSIVIFWEGISGGAVSAAFVAFLYGKCKTGSQYALLWAAHEVGGMFFRLISGFLVDQIGWRLFFIVTPLLSIPGLIVLGITVRLKGRSECYICKG